MKDQIVALITLVTTAILLQRFAVQFYREIRFYRSVNWDFTIDSEFSGSATEGGIFGHQKGNPMSNQARVMFALPLALFVLFFGLVFSVFIFLES
jgi:hypothetical protein